MNDQDFENMDWRLDLLKPEQSVLEEYPLLAQRFKKFMLDSIKVLNTLTNDQLVRYIVLCYHKNSPFVRKITEVKQRKTQVLVHIGYKFEGEMPEEIQEIMDSENEKVGDMILAFLEQENNRNFSALMMQMDAYYKLNQRLASNDGKNLQTAVKGLNELSMSIDALSHDVFSGDTKSDNFVQGAKTRGFITSPESFAHQK